MNIINKILLGMAGLASMWMCACSDGSEELLPSESYVNFFEVPESDNSESASLRRDFFANTGIYLLFTDELARYTDDFGNERVETVDFNWAFTDHNSIKYKFDTLKDDEQAKAVELISKYFIPYINVEGGQLKPYSILLVKNLENSEGNYYDDELDPKDYMSCWRCFCINVSDWLEADDERAFSLGQSLLASLVSTKIDENSQGLDSFFEICDGLYDEYVYDFIDSWMDSQDIELVYESGFMRYVKDWYDEPDYDKFVTRKTDLKNFMDALFGGTEDDFMDTWGDYPVIVEKYRILKECVEKLGIDFNAVKI